MKDKNKKFLPLGIAILSLPLLQGKNNFKPAPHSYPRLSGIQTFVKDSTDVADSLLMNILKKETVYNTDFIRSTFYTWTTKEQIEELRKNKKLLTHSKASTGDYSLFDLALKDTSLLKDPFAKLLQSEQFKNKRFGWTNAWATVMGWEGEKYGDQLLKITLDEKAIIGSFIPDDDIPIKFYDTKGKLLSEKEVMDNVNRIAVIYHVGTRKGSRSEAHGTIGKPGRKKVQMPYREYVILNESMIKLWSYGTGEIKDELMDELELLEKLNKYAVANDIHAKYYTYYTYYAQPFVLEKNYHLRVEDLYYACTTFENDLYLFNMTNVLALFNKIKKTMALQGMPITK